MVSDETMMFSFKDETNRVEKIICDVCDAMREKGYNPINQLVGYIISGEPAYITSNKGARSQLRQVDRDDLLEELIGFYLEKHKCGDI